MKTRMCFTRLVVTIYILMIMISIVQYVYLHAALSYIYRRANYFQGYKISRILIILL